VNHRSPPVRNSLIAMVGCVVAAAGCGNGAAVATTGNGGAKGDAGVSSGGATSSGANTGGHPEGGGGAGGAGFGGTAIAGSGVGGAASHGGAAGDAPGGAGGALALPPGDSYRQFGGERSDEVRAVAVDASENLYVAGFTQAVLSGTTLAGTFDIFVRKYDAAGTVLWTLQWGRRGYNNFGSLAVEPGGDFYVSGSYVEFASSGPDKTTYFLNKYDPAGKVLWSKEVPWSAAVIRLDAANNLYAAGAVAGATSGSTTGALYVRKYDPSATEQWTARYGLPLIESVADLGVDGAGNVFVAGATQGTVEDPNTGKNAGRLYKFDGKGAAVWDRMFTTVEGTLVSSVAVLATGEAYVTGYTYGALVSTNLGANDAFLRKYDAAGNAIWTRQFGTPLGDVAWAVRADAAGSAYVTGTTEGAVETGTDGGNGGKTSHPSAGYLRKYASDGTVVWTKQCPTTAVSTLYSLAVAASGNLYAGGYAYGAIAGVAGGQDDALVAKFSVP